MVKTTHQIKPLTTLRFVAALYVVLYHTLTVAAPHLWHSFLNYGYCSVSFFFVLSGFVLAVAYLDRPGTLVPKDFWIARFARIYPLFALTAVLDVPFLIWLRIGRYGLRVALLKTVVTTVATLLMVKSWAPMFLFGLDDPNWSLSVEAFFYLLFPLVAKRLWNRSLGSSAAVLALFYVAGVAMVRLAMQMHLSDNIMLREPLLHTPQFLEGILLGKFYTYWMSRESVSHRLQSWSLAIVVTALGLLWLLLRQSTPASEPILLDGGLFPVFGALIIAFSSGARWIERLFSASWLVLLGEASYGLYLLHIVVWHYTSGYILYRPSLVPYGVYLIGTVSLSIVSFLFFEKPARAWVLHWSRVRPREGLLVSSLAE